MFGNDYEFGLPLQQMTRHGKRPEGGIRLALFALAVVNCYAKRERLTLDLCRPCYDRFPNVIPQNEMSNVYTETIRNIITLTSINTQETCRFYNDVHEKDVSAFHVVNPLLISNRRHQLQFRDYGSDIINAYNNLTTIAMYYKFGNLRRQTTEGLTLPLIENKVQFLLCSLKAAAESRDIHIPRTACDKTWRIHLPVNRAAFGRNVLSMLHESRLQLCYIFNGLGTNIGAPALQCDQITSMNEVCSRE